MKNIQEFMDSIAENENVNDIRRKVAETFPEAMEDTQFNFWVKYAWGSEGLDSFEKVRLKNNLISLYDSIAASNIQKAMQEKQYVSYITVYTSASIVPVQNRVKVIGTFRELMKSVANLEMSVSRDIGVPVKSFEMKSCSSSQEGRINPAIDIILTLFV